MNDCTVTSGYTMVRACVADYRRPTHARSQLPAEALTRSFEIVREEGLLFFYSAELILKNAFVGLCTVTLCI